MTEYFNKNLKYIRKMKKMSQQQLADKIGVDRSSISYWEKGNDITITNAVKVAKALGIPFPEFLGSDLTEKNVELNNKKVNIILDKTKDLSEEDLEKISQIIDIYSKKK